MRCDRLVSLVIDLGVIPAPAAQVKRACTGFPQPLAATHEIGTDSSASQRKEEALQGVFRPPTITKASSSRPIAALSRTRTSQASSQLLEPV